MLPRGKTTRLTAVGSRLGNALDVWPSLPAGKLTAKVVPGAKDGSASFAVKVADDAPVGVFAWRRPTG